MDEEIKAIKKNDTWELTDDTSQTSLCKRKEKKHVMYKTIEFN
jgi:hypothetical protein